MIAYKKTQDGSHDCTITKRVTMGDVHGCGRGAITLTLQSLDDVATSTGAPDGGPRCCFPRNVQNFPVSR